MNDELWMSHALELADRAAAIDEVPVGAVLVRDGELIGEGFNQLISACDPTAHAENVALRDAARRVGNYRLPGSTLYATLEPCTMCVGAIIHARVERLIFAAIEPRAGMICSRARLLDAEHYNHRIVWEQGLMAVQSADKLKHFFRARRNH